MHRTTSNHIPSHHIPFHHTPLTLTTHLAPSKPDNEEDDAKLLQRWGRCAQGTVAANQSKERVGHVPAQITLPSFSYFSLPYLTSSRLPYRRVYVNPEVFYEMEVRIITIRRTIIATEIRAPTLSLLFCTSHCVSYFTFSVPFILTLSSQFQCRYIFFTTHLSYC
jgi:hypothetical protein